MARFKALSVPQAPACLAAIAAFYMSLEMKSMFIGLTLNDGETEYLTSVEFADRVDRLPLAVQLRPFLTRFGDESFAQWKGECKQGRVWVQASEGGFEASRLF